MRKISQGIMKFFGESRCIFHRLIFNPLCFNLRFAAVFFWLCGIFFPLSSGIRVVNGTAVIRYFRSSVRICYRLDCESFCHDMQRKRKKLPLLHDY